MGELIRPESNSESTISEVAKKLPEWVIEQSRARGQWFQEIYQAATSEQRKILLGNHCSSYRDVIIGAKPATDFMYFSDQSAEALGQLAEQVAPPEPVPPNHIKLLHVPYGKETEIFLVNLDALPHIVSHNADLFRDYSSINWPENSLPVISDSEDFIAEGLSKDYARVFGLLMGFPRRAVEHWIKSREKDPTGTIDHYVNQEIETDPSIQKIHSEYQIASNRNRPKIREAYSAALENAFAKAKKRIKELIVEGVILSEFQETIDDPISWQKLKEKYLDSRWIYTGGISYRDETAGPDEGMERYRLIREASGIEKIVEDLRSSSGHDISGQDNDTSRKKLPGPSGKLPR